MAARLPQRPRLHGGAAVLFRESLSPGSEDGEASEARECIHDLESTLRPLVATYWLEPHPPGRAKISIEPLRSSEAFPLVLSEAHFLSLDDLKRNRKMVDNYLALVQSVPVFRLSFEWNLDVLFEVVARLEQHQRRLAGFHN
jgi:hypothetical protein